MESTEREISNCIDESIKVKKQLKKTSYKVINQISKEIIRAFQDGNKVLWFGNGGSAADSQHLSAELIGKFYKKRKALESIALTTNTSILTALSNDFDFSYIFARQVEALVKPGDIVIGLSTSGNSPNVILGLESAKKLGGITVALTGALKDRGIEEHVDYLIEVPSADTPRIQESHIMIGHIICYLVENLIFEKKSDTIPFVLKWD